MNLFDRLPAELFRPLTGVNRRETWALLVRLYERFFGPEALPPQEEGFLLRDVTMEIERFLLECHDWHEEGDGTAQATAPPQASLILRRFTETGWLREERVGVRSFISMHPTITRLLETLHQFAVGGPQLIGGQVQMIYNQLKQVMEQPESQAQGFQSAAQESVRLINTLNATAVRVKDVLADLGYDHATEVFVRRFFSEYISELYIRDYRQLLTDNHPLKHRWEIVSMVHALRDDERKRTALLAGYEALPRGKHETALAMLEMDIARFLRFVEIERYLDRLDHSVNEATRRSVTFLSYRLKTSDRLEFVIEQSIAAVCAVEDRGLPLEGRLLPPGQLLSEERLRAPVARLPNPPRVALTRRPMTPRERALFLLRRSMTRHRDVTPESLRRYVDRAMEHRHAATSDELAIATVEDACAYLVLSRLALWKRAAHGRRLLPHPLLRRAAIDVEFLGGERTVNDCLDSPRFEIKRRS